jgi:hypothetical protein
LPIVKYNAPLRGIAIKIRVKPWGLLAETEKTLAKGLKLLKFARI